jgi:hypothetical protein
MLQQFGLTKDPFAPVWDGALFWETPERAEARKRILAALGEGRGVWVRGPSGSGRGTLLARLSAELAAQGVPVLRPATDAPTDGLAFLTELADTGGCLGERPELVSRAEALYACLLARFCSTGPILVVPTADPLPSGAWEEAEILAGLRIAGYPLVRLLLAGEGAVSIDGLQEVELPFMGPEDVRAFLAHRASVCGNATLLPSEVLEEIGDSAHGLGHALVLARKHLARMAFQIDLPPPAAADSRLSLN